MRLAILTLLVACGGSPATSSDATDTAAPTTPSGTTLPDAPPPADQLRGFVAVDVLEDFGGVVSIYAAFWAPGAGVETFVPDVAAPALDDCATGTAVAGAAATVDAGQLVVDFPGKSAAINGPNSYGTDLAYSATVDPTGWFAWGATARLTVVGSDELPGFTAEGVLPSGPLGLGGEGRSLAWTAAAEGPLAASYQLSEADQTLAGRCWLRDDGAWDLPAASDPAWLGTAPPADWSLHLARGATQYVDLGDGTFVAFTVDTGASDLRALDAP